MEPEPTRSGGLRRFLGVLATVFLCTLLIYLGAIGMKTIAGLKKPPEEAKQEERAIQVEAFYAKRENVPVFITGYGEVKALNEVSIAPEVSGKVVKVHPRLELGEVIPKGEVLFQIDSRDYLAACKEEQAVLDQWKNTISRVETEWEIDLERQKTIQRNRDLAKTEYERVFKLYRESRIGARSEVDAAEKTYNTAQDVADQMRQKVALYPIKKRDAQNNLNAAAARLEIAKTRLDRCTVHADFDGRIKQVAVETGQYVTAGQNVLTMADDSILEIRVPLDSRDVRRWLQFKPQKVQEDVSWFQQLEPAPCRIQWTEDRTGHFWEGRLHQVIKFDQQTRTVTVGVRVRGESLGPSSGGLPLVEGMFCSVRIPGKVMRDVIRIPRHAVTYNNFVYVSVDRRLKAFPVNVVRAEGEEAFIDEGLHTGDIVVTTRLVNPLENSLLEITKLDGGDLKS